jgi:CelD/BcsL family acetyltransferase involved in cellulose biosynthesis
MYSVDLVSDKAAFLALEGEWNDADDRAAVSHPFLRHEWVRTWWEAFGGQGARQLHVLVVRRGSRPCAIAPLMFERAQMYGVPVRRLRFLQNDHTPRADVIVAGDVENSYRALWHAIQDGGGPWDVLQLSQIPGDSESRDRFRQLAAADGRPTGVWPSGAAPYLRLPSTWEAFARGLSSKLRQNLRNRLGRLARFGEPRLEVLADRNAIRDGSGDAQRLEDSGWKRTEGTAIASDPLVEHFYRLLTGRADQCAWLRLLFLSVGGRRVAVAYAAAFANRLFLLKTGYDPAFATCSPFKLLTFFAARHAIEQGFDEIDFLGDAEPWKLEWTTATRPHDWLFVFSATPRGRLLHPLKFQVVPALRRTCSFQPSRA